MPLWPIQVWLSLKIQTEMQEFATSIFVFHFLFRKSKTSGVATGRGETAGYGTE